MEAAAEPAAEEAAEAQAVRWRDDKPQEATVGPQMATVEFMVAGAAGRRGGDNIMPLLSEFFVFSVFAQRCSCLNLSN